MKATSAAACLLALLLHTAGCYSFSTFQTPRLLEPGQWSVTPAVSRQVHVQRGDPEDLWSLAEVQVRRGVARHVELGGRVCRIGLTDGYQFAAAEPKVALVRGRLAVLLPIGLFFGEGQDEGESWQVNPTLVGSVPLGAAVELDAAVKRLVFLGDASDDVWAANLGPRVQRAGDRAVVHPEVGLLRLAGGDGWILQWGGAVCVPLGR